MRRLRSQTCAAILCVRYRLFFSGRRGAAPYGLIRKCGSPPLCLFSPVCFSGRRRRPPTMTGGNLVCYHIVCYFRMFAKREAKRLPYKRDFIQRRRAGAMFAKQTCHGAKRSMLASRRNVVCTIIGNSSNKKTSQPTICRLRRNILFFRINPNPLYYLNYLI